MEFQLQEWYYNHLLLILENNLGMQWRINYYIQLDIGFHG
uniref:ORF39 n=1 Tax=Phytophthora infestans TaxID=4787 RepID=Q52V89_PHYIN|nr:ORF39 [Phytophthora infestans]AAW67072.1 ORF39 [Phytophthora infestans]ADK36699.1 unknown [Phytophthora infestans]ADZ32025.1 ORF39 [Phytophthora infestans]ADZ32033.1 ORF39 [Phytophthora infestans]